MRRAFLTLLLTLGMVFGFGSAALRLAFAGYHHGPHACAHADGMTWSGRRPAPSTKPPVEP